MQNLGDELESYLKQFKLFLCEEEKEESTIKMYVTEIYDFLEWLQSQNKPLFHVLQEDIIVRRNEMYGKGMKFSTINKSVSILSSFFKWAQKQGYVTVNPAEHIRLFEPKKNNLPKCLTEEEEERLLKYAAKEKNPFKKARNEALIYVMLYAGLRVEEVSQLRLESLHGEELIVYDHDAESRTVPIDEMTHEKLEAWKNHRLETSKQIYQESPFLFVTERSGNMQPRSIQFVIEGYSEKLGFELLCQHLRNKYCRRLAEQGVPIEQIRKRAGHKSILTTHQYFAGLQ